MTSGSNAASYFCPRCQSPLITRSALAGGEAKCEASCGWVGRNEDLLGHHFETGFANEEDILRAFARDIKMLLARDGVGVSVGRLILKWGFVQTLDAPTLARYLSSIARAIARAILEERRQMEKERQNVS